MKKLAAATLAMSMTLSCAAANVHADGRAVAIRESITNKSEIHILYNDKIVQYEDVKPVNTEGRVMIPFRAALENMGATVNYDNSNRLVTASKGDINISFTLMDDTIYVDKNGAKSTITMDVPMIIVQDRTLVPIRFMSNAFGMQVGWDGNTETVIIMDYNDYLDDFSGIAPNMTKLTELNTPNFNIETTEFNFAADYTRSGESMKINTNGKADSVASDVAKSIDVALDFDGMGVSMKDASASLVLKDSVLYLKTDILEQIAKSSQNANVQLASMAVNGNSWYRVDLKKLIDSADMDDASKEVFKSLIAMNGTNGLDFKKALTAGVHKEGEADINEAIFLAAQIDTYAAFDKYITVTEKENGGYSVSINMTNDDFVNLVSNDVLQGTLSAEEIQKLKSMMSFSILAKTDCDGEKAESNINVSAKVNDPGEKLNLNFTISQTGTKDTSALVPTVPSSSVDLTDVIIGK
ncbi:MAG: copper amine oxidase N-terminal domain-containing protein [Oscillospiraceae bacterium]|nr:copper amine oxidase N-terminal domain-containing protein [Oscillospiraceae bacterium]